METKTKRARSRTGQIARTHLPEAEGKVAHRLRQRLDAHGLVVREAVVLRLHSGVVHEGSRVRDQAAHRRADVGVHLHDLLTRNGGSMRQMMGFKGV